MGLFQQMSLFLTWFMSFFLFFSAGPIFLKLSYLLRKTSDIEINRNSNRGLELNLLFFGELCYDSLRSSFVVGRFCFLDEN